MAFAVDITTSDGIAAAAQREREDSFREACHLRILAVVDHAAQINLAAAAAADALPVADLGAYRLGLAWIEEMRGRWRVLALDPAADPSDDERWPDVPPEAQALARRF
jgi:hypothetical protein